MNYFFTSPATAAFLRRLNFLPRTVAYAFLLLTLAFYLSGCANVLGQKNIEHGFNVENIGEEKISQVVIQYGAVTKEFCKQGCFYKGGSFYGVYMPIQSKMFVTWKTADGLKHEVTVLVKEKIKDVNRFRRLFLEFSGAKLVVKQGASFTAVGEVGWEESSLYP